MSRPPVAATAPRGRATGALALLAAVLLAAGVRAETRFVPLDPGSAQAMRSAARIPAPSLAGPGTVLLLPFFEVDATGFAETTAVGIRNPYVSQAVTVDVSYYDVHGNPVATENDVVIPAGGVYSRNLRDVSGLPTDAEGFKRGFAYFVIDGFGLISGDYFQIDPLNAFASGGRLVANGDACYFYDIRFATGGAFSGGTRFQLFVDVPLGTASGDPPSASFTIHGEDGTTYGDVGLMSDQPVNDFTIGDILAALPGGVGPSFGSADVLIPAAAGYGLLQATYSAEGQYSVGIPGSCAAPAP